MKKAYCEPQLKAHSPIAGLNQARYNFDFSPVATKTPLTPQTTAKTPFTPQTTAKTPFTPQTTAKTPFTVKK